MNVFKTTVHFLTFSCLANLTSLNAQAQDTPPPAEIKSVEPELPKSKLSGTIYFKNGDSITGQIIHWTLNEITIKSPDFIEPITFENIHALNIILEDQRNFKEINELADETSLIIQHRGNQHGLHGVVKGGFTNIDDTHVTLNTTYAGVVKVLKKFVTKMEVDSKKGYLYKGPNNLEEWHNNNLASYWKYSNEALFTENVSGNIAKDIKLPDSAILSFDLSWKNDERIDLYLYSSDPEQTRPDNYYKVDIRNRRINMYKYVDGQRRTDITSKKARERRLGLLNNDLVKDRKHTHFDIYMSKKEGIFHIFRDGILIDSLVDAAPKPKNFGSAIHLISSNKSPIRVKNLTLSKWSGHLPSAVDQEAFAKLKGSGQKILLKNGDILLGEIDSLKNGIIKIDTLYTPINLPVVRMRSIDLTSDEAKHEPIMYENDIKCWFKNEGWIILKPISIKGNKLIAYHQALGENEFDLNAFKRIDLNIYTNNPNELISSDDW